MDVPKSQDNVTVMVMQIITTAGAAVTGMEKGWLDGSRSGRAVMTGCFLFGLALYYVLFPDIFALGIYSLGGITFSLLTVLPLLAG